MGVLLFAVGGGFIGGASVIRSLARRIAAQDELGQPFDRVEKRLLRPGVEDDGAVRTLSRQHAPEERDSFARHHRASPARISPVPSTTAPRGRGSVPSSL